MEWESVIGLEVHVQLATRSKIFSGASAAFGGDANAQACALDLGMPGTLPVLNREAVRMALTFGLAIGADIAPACRFDRKNYFYPDLPKGYQISQFDAPIVGRGALAIDAPDGERRIGITRAHLEEDAGKSLHENYAGMSGIDLNRAGTPLLEVVSEPDLRAPEEAAAFFRELRTLVRHLRISDGNLNEGSMRCDANVSVRRPGDPLGVRTEIKNLNSFRFIERAIRHEIERQIDAVQRGEPIVRETRLYDAQADETRPMRGKELSDDYRYFPDPDLLPVRITAELLAEARAHVPELPRARRRRYAETLGLSDYEAEQMAQSPDVAAYFDATIAAGGKPERAAHWVMDQVAAALNRTGKSIKDCPVAPRQLAQLLERIADGSISGKIAAAVFDILWNEGGEVDAIIQAHGWRQLSDSGALARVVAEAVAAHPAQARQFRDGKAKLLGFFVGQVMRATDGKADPKRANELLLQALQEG